MTKASAPARLALDDLLEHARHGEGLVEIALDRDRAAAPD